MPQINTLHFFKKLSTLIFLLAVLGSSILVKPNLVLAASGCEAVPISVTSVFVPANFIPLVPEECGQQKNGDIKPLTINDLPTMLIRLFGFFAAIITYLFGFMIIVSGLQWAWGGIDGTSTATAKRNLQNSFMALILTFSAYTIINTILIVLKVDDKVLSSDIAGFFK